MISHLLRPRSLGRITLAVVLVLGTAVAAQARPAPRTRALFARLDSLAAFAPPDSVGRWVAGPECGASPDSGARAVAAALRARQLLAGARYASCAAQARAAIAHARATRDTLLECRALYALGMAHALSGDTAPAPAHARRLVALARAARLPRDEAYGRLTLAYLDVLAERHARAERGYRAALAGFSPRWDATARRIARVGLSRAVFQQGRTREARALDVEIIRESRSAHDAVNEAIALNNLAVHDVLAGDPADAVPQWRRALALQRAGGRTQDAATTALNLAGALDRLGRHDEASELLEEFADSTRVTLRAWQRAEVVALLATVRSRQLRLSEAERLALWAWDLFAAARARPGLSLLGARAAIVTGQGDAGRALALVDEWLVTQPGDPLDPEDALMARGIAATQLLRAGRHAEALERWHALGSQVDTSAALGQMKFSYVRLGEALAHFGLGEAARGRSALRAALRAWELGRGAFRAPQWRELMERDGLYLWGNALARLRLAEGGEREAFDMAQRLKARTFSERMRGTHGTRGTSGAARAPVTLAVLQRRVLHAGEVAFDAFPGSDSLLVFVVTRDALRAYTVPGRASLQQRAARLMTLATGAGAAAEASAAAARELSHELLDPAGAIVAGARQWLVTSDGVTEALPWDLLPAPGSARALGESRAVASVPSLGALARLRERPAAAARPGPLVLAGLSGPDGRALEGVRDEVAFLRARYAGADVRAPRDGAGVRAALEALRAAAAVHVAAHFAIDPENPWRNGVLLGPPERDASWLRAADLEGAQVGAELVVLAGCGSAAAGAADVRGERGLASAFLAAGARAAVGTLGPVEDHASAAFVRELYAALDRGVTAAEALATARAAVRTSSGAAFVLSGDPEARVRLPRRSPPGLPGWGR